MSSTPDTEITLGTGKLLMLFFGMVAVCAVFFGMGYSLGRGSGKPAIAEAASPATPAVTRPAVQRTSEASGKSDLTFYKAVGQKDTDPTLTPAAQTTQATSESATPANKGPAAPDPAAIASGSSYYVQVAAVSKQEDAEALVDALKKKQYPAFTANGSANDKLFRVQVGPYGEVKDAETMRTKLISDGYNPILKK
ncbi:MAG TPA: SPOR domain-containing protein [Terriglobales bacterium]|jgi:cell division septation protein DedD|nr:SPOR domain-containing protein [Terriglobales bacterium]